MKKWFIRSKNGLTYVDGRGQVVTHGYRAALYDTEIDAWAAIAELGLSAGFEPVFTQV